MELKLSAAIKAQTTKGYKLYSQSNASLLTWV